MSIPLWCLAIALVIPYLAAGIAVYFKNQQFGTIDNNNPRAQAASLEGAGARALAAQQNAWEALAVFTAAVVIASLTDADPAKSAIASVIFVIARCFHAGFYIADLASLRSLSFAVGFACCLYLIGLGI